MTLKLLAFDGSGRNGSVNHKLLNNVADEAKAAGIEVTVIDLSNYNLPLYNGDLEFDDGLPPAGHELKELFKSHDGFLIASPEYNGSFTPMLKNVIDWVSRPVKGEPPLNSFKGKIAGIMSATPGKLGGLRGMIQLNTLLFGVGTLVLPEIVSVSFSNEAFDDAGKLKHDADKGAVERQVKRLVQIGSALK